MPFLQRFLPTLLLLALLRDALNELPGLAAASDPASVPPARMRDTGTDKSVVLPVFQWLVRSVMDPKAMNPCQSQPGNSLPEFAISA